MKVIRCLSFVAVSTKHQGEQDSPDSQSRGNIAFIDQLGKYYPGYQGVFVGEVRIVGTRSIPSLEQACDRYPDEYGVMRTAITDGTIDMIVCRERDRLGRKFSLVAQIADLCDSHNVIILARNSNLPPSLNMAHIKADESRPIIAAVEGALAETYVRRFRARSRDGREARVREKKMFSGRPPYGYAYKYHEDGKKEIVIVQKQADVLLEFFNLYLSGHGETYCVKHFNKSGVESPKGGRWYRSAFNPFARKAMIYAGYVDMYRDKRGKGDRFMVKGEHPAIISVEMAEEVERERKRRSFTRSISHTAFSGVCVCTACGRKLQACADHYRSKSGETLIYRGYSCKNIDCPSKAKVSYRIVRDCLRSAILEIINQSTADQYPGQSDVEDRIRSTQNAIDATMQSISNAKDGKETLLDLLLEKKLNRQQYDERTGRIDKQIEQLQAELDDRRSEINQLKDQASVKDRMDEIRQYGMDYLAKEHTDPEAASAWLKMHFRVYVRPGRGEKIKKVEYI